MIKTINSTKLSNQIQKFPDLSLDILEQKCNEIQLRLKSDKENGNLDPATKIELSTLVGKDNIKKYIRFFIRKNNDNFDIVKQTRTVRIETVMTRINKAIERRKQWGKFGEPKKRGNEGITMTKGNVYFMKPNGDYLFDEDKIADNAKSIKPKMRISTNTKPKAWRSKRVSDRKTNPEEEGPESNKFKFTSRRDDNDKTLFVSNISSDTTEEDLYTLFGEYGKVKFISLPKHRRGPKTGQMKGIAFVKYYNISTAEKALDANGRALDHMRLGVKMASQNK